MPYVKTVDRMKIDDEIDNLVTQFRLKLGWGATGSANYVITRVVLGCMKPSTGWTYDALSDVIKTLECSKMEIARKLIDKYEDKCIQRNGDIQELIL